MAASVPLFPVHKVCRVNVEHPTILVEEQLGRKVVLVQWFGEAWNTDLGTSQFLFPLTMKFDDARWLREPELFRVAFMDQVKNWPNKDAISAIAHGLQNGEETWVIWVVSSYYAQRTTAGIRCASFMCGLVMLGDPNVGVITPKRFWDENVPREEQAKVEK